VRFLILQETNWDERGPHQQHHLMERLSIIGHQVRVIDYDFLWAQKPKPLFSKKKMFYDTPKIIKNAKIKVIRPGMINLPIVCYVSLPFYHFSAIIEQIKSYKPDHIIGFGIINSCIGLILSKWYKIPFYYYLIDHLHNLLPMKVFQPIAKLFESYNIKNCDKLLAINQGLIDYSLNLNGNPEKSFLIPGGVDIEKYEANEVVRTEIRQDLKIKSKDTVLMFMGWLYDFSGLKEIIDYMLENEDLIPDVRCLIVGDGDLFSYISEKRKLMKHPEKVILTGKVPFEFIPKYLQAADFCLLPAYKNKIMENIVPIKLYEYIASGNPVIATNLPGIFKEFGNNNGIIYIEHPEEVFEKIQMGRELIEDVIENGQRFIKDYDWVEIVKKFLEIV
jgi:glycosyltransferase involved in cell wall biosynthesis